MYNVKLVYVCVRVSAHVRMCMSACTHTELQKIFAGQRVFTPWTWKLESESLPRNKTQLHF